MHKLLLAINSQALTELLTQELTSQFDIHSCRSGTDAVVLIDTLRPDALVIDFQLPGLSGLTVLESCAFRPAVVIALADYLDDGTIRRLEPAGVSLLLQIPCTARCIAEHLKSMMEESPSPA